MKLFSTNAPLKVLISYGYPVERQRDLESGDFLLKYIAQDFIEYGQLNGIHAILLYDNAGVRPAFHLFAFDSTGKQIAEESEKIVWN